MLGGGEVLPLPYPSLGLLEESLSSFAGGPGGAVVLCLGARKKGTLYNTETGKGEQELGCP